MKQIMLIALLLICGAMQLSAQDYNLSFVMNRLWCDQTTEMGEDEIYLRVIVKTSSGAYLNTRQPSEHWNMNDGNDPRNVDGVTLLRTHLNAGESGTIIVIVCEEDGGGSEQWQQLGETILSACDHPYCIAAQQISYWTRQLGLTIHDTDDYIGSFSINFGFDNNGKFWWERQNLERYCSEEKWGETGTKIRLCGDGADYTGWFSFGNGN
jgi:hypothetical protein